MYKILYLTQGRYLTGNDFYFGLQHISSAYKSCPGNYTWDGVYKHQDTEDLQFNNLQQCKTFAVYYTLKARKVVPEELLIINEKTAYSCPIANIIYV